MNYSGIMSDTDEKTVRDEDQHLPAKDDHLDTATKAASKADSKDTHGKIFSLLVVRSQ